MSYRLVRRLLSRRSELFLQKEQLWGKQQRLVSRFCCFRTLSSSQQLYSIDEDNGVTKCSIRLVESIPEGMGFEAELSTVDAWTELISSAKKTIDISAVYFTLKSEEPLPSGISDEAGKLIYDSLVDAAKRGVSIRAVTNPGSRWNSNDAEVLAGEGHMHLRFSGTERLTRGINHAKIIIVDDMHFYIGSANMDWRALSQIREVGYMVKNCNVLAVDIKKIFETLWLLSQPGANVPGTWPKHLTTDINRYRAAPLEIKKLPFRGYFSAAPNEYTTPRRTFDITAILSVIRSAREFVHIEVFTYLPLLKYRGRPEYWPVIDDALRIAATRGVKVRLIVGHWQKSIREHLPYLRSLDALKKIKGRGSIEVKMFVVPSTPEQASVPFSRVNHAKFMVTEKAAYVGTSNWTKDYFVGTTGVAFVLEDGGFSNEGPVEDLRLAFWRDWNSPYALPLPEPT